MNNDFVAVCKVVFMWFPSVLLLVIFLQVNQMQRQNNEHTNNRKTNFCVQNELSLIMTFADNIELCSFHFSCSYFCSYSYFPSFDINNIVCWENIIIIRYWPSLCKPPFTINQKFDLSRKSSVSIIDIICNFHMKHKKTRSTLVLVQVE